VNEIGSKANVLSIYTDIFDAVMRTFLFAILVCGIFFSVIESNAKPLTIVKDLYTEWQVSDGHQFFSYQKYETSVSTIYLIIDLSNFKSHSISIESRQPFNLFINGQLAMEGQLRGMISLDSLSHAFKTHTALLAINTNNQNIDSNSLTTYLCNNDLLPTSNTNNAELRTTDYFRDFVLTALIILFIYWVILVRLSPRLSADYFSIAKIFFGRETEDYQYFRLTSANILFYGFSCLLLGITIFIVAHFYTIDFIVDYTYGASYFRYFLQWILLSLLLLIILSIKIFLIFLLTSLFKVNEIGGFQFFNFMRVLLVMSVTITVLISSYYILHGQHVDVYGIAYKMIGWIMLFWVIIIFFKLVSRVPFSPFHLFLYICATEIIPFLITVKILYK
jgi:hypothetical protein